MTPIEIIKMEKLLVFRETKWCKTFKSIRYIQEFTRIHKSKMGLQISKLTNHLQRIHTLHLDVSYLIRLSYVELRNNFTVSHHIFYNDTGNIRGIYIINTKHNS